MGRKVEKVFVTPTGKLKRVDGRVVYRSEISDKAKFYVEVPAKIKGKFDKWTTNRKFFKKV